MTDLEVGRKYRRDDMSPSDWVAHVAALREGDEVEVWRSNHSGVRGLVAADRSGELVVRSAVTGADVGRLTNCDGPLASVSEFTVTKLVPRGPEWAGARAVAVDGHVFVGEGNGFFSGAGGSFAPWELELLGTVYVLIDADGRVPVETVMHMNGVSWGDLQDALTSRSFFATMDTVESVVDALGGKR